MYLRFRNIAQNKQSKCKNEIKYKKKNHAEFTLVATKLILPQLKMGSEVTTPMNH